MAVNRDAQRTYESLCNTLTNINWKFQRDDENLVVRTNAIGEDLTISLYVTVSAERNLMYTKSPMPFTVPQNKQREISLAVNIANFSMLNGCFEYDVSSGYLGFKIVVPFGGCLISEDTCHYMIMLTCQMVDKFNDKFKKIIEDKMSVEQFDLFVNPKMPEA